MPDYLLGLLVGMAIGVVGTLAGVIAEGHLHRRTAGVKEPRAVTPQEDGVLRRAAMRSAKVVSAGVDSVDGGQR